MSQLLEIDHITKRYGPVLAVNDVSFTVNEGEIHSLVGENGAGKSTLVKMITGLEKQNSGEIRLNNRPCLFNTPIEAHAAGISVVYQDPKLFPHLDLAENIFMGIYPTNKIGFVSKKRMYAEAKRLLDSLNVDLDPRSLVSGLSVADIQFMEIARALSSEVKLLILDEPTASLTPVEADRLFDLFRNLKKEGTSIIFISHRLEEIRKISDRITVMRDGNHIITSQAEDLSQDDMVRAMVGRELKSLFVSRKPDIDSSRKVLEVRSLSRTGDFTDVSFSVHAGEIVGMAGLVGAGRTEIAESIFGLRPPTGGEILVNGAPIKPTSSRVMKAAGIAYVPEDRDANGLIMEMGVSTNVTLTVLDRLSHAGFIRHQWETAFTQGLADDLSIKTTTTDTEVRELSGGNRQKVVFAKWLATKPSIFILDEPTHGIDVGSKAQVHEKIAALADAGFAVLLISSDLPEILGMSDRILVVSSGRIVDEFNRNDADQEKVMLAATSQIGSGLSNEQ